MFELKDFNEFYFTSKFEYKSCNLKNTKISLNFLSTFFRKTMSDFKVWINMKK